MKEALSQTRRFNWFSIFALVFGIVVYFLPTPKGHEWLDWCLLATIALNIASIVVYWRKHG